MFNAADRALDTAAFNYTNAAMQFTIASGIFNVRAILTTDLTTRTAALTTGVRSVLAGALTLASSAAVAELGRSERNRGRWIVFFVCTSTPFSRWEVIIQVLSESHGECSANEETQGHVRHGGHCWELSLVGFPGLTRVHSS